MKHPTLIPHPPSLIPHLLLALCLGGALAADAAVQLKWTVETSRVQPVAFDAVHGESIALEAAFKSYGTDVQLPSNAALYYQTNGMGSTWWTAPATVTSNRVSATLTPSMVPCLGAAPSADRTVVNGFLGTTGEIFRALFTLRFRHGPGAVPNTIAAPVPILDLANTTVINPPWPTTNDFTTATNRMEATLKSYVDAEIVGAGVVTPTTVTNIVDAKIADIPKEGVSTNAVSGIITNHVTSGYLCTVAKSRDLGGDDITNAYIISSWAGSKLQLIGDGLRIYDLNNRGFDLNYEWLTTRASEDYVNSYAATNLGAIAYADAHFAPTSTAVTVASHASQLSQLSQSVSSNATTVGRLATQVTTIGAHLNAEDARFVSTNYNSATRIPEAYVEVKQSNEWLRVWSEMTRWNAFTGSAFDWTTWGGFHAWSTNVAAQLDGKSPRQYAFYDGVTGGVAPDDYFWISQPHVAVCAGAGYQRYVDGAHEVWVLESNGMVADVNGTTNGYFRITDSEGDTQFEIIKGDKQTVFANAYAMTMTNVNGVTHYYTTYAVTNAVAAPTARVSVTGPASGFTAEGSSCPANVSWTAGQNCYVLEWWPKSSYSQMFVKADYERGGDTIIKNNAPVQMQTIYIGGKKYSISVTTIDGKTVPQLTEVQ